MSDFLICGAGVSGLLLARELLAGGATVTVVERGETGREASWAGGGIVSPLYPWRYSDAVTALASAAQAAYPQLAAELLDETGIDVQLSVTGLLMLDADDQSEALDWAQRQQRRMQLLRQNEVYQCVSGLAGGFQQGLWMPDIANIRNPRLMKALKAAVMKMPGATLIEQCEVRELLGGQSGIRHADVIIQGQHRVLQAHRYIVATGAWSARLLESTGLRLPVEPVKGQMLLYEASPRLLSTMVLTKGRYLIPRRDGHILIGSTLEYAGFDKTADREAMKSLHTSACGMLPALADCPVKAHWAGLRPGAPAGIPFIGRLPGFENLYINAGHFRNGLVLAPASARLLADSLLGRQPSLDPAPYDPVARLGTG